MKPRFWCSYDYFLHELERLWESEQTGTLVCVTKQTHTATLSLAQGEIVGLSFRTTTGRAALPLLATLGRCQLTFVPSNQVRRDDDLPENLAIFTALERAESTTGLGVPLHAPTATIPPLTCRHLEQFVEHELGVLQGTQARLSVRQHFATHPLPANLKAINHQIRVAVADHIAPEDIAALIDRVLRKAGLPGSDTTFPSSEPP